MLDEKRDEIADAMRRRQARSRGVDPGRLLAFELLTKPERQAWLELADAAIEVVTPVLSYAVDDAQELGAGGARPQLPVGRYDGATTTDEDKPRLDRQLQRVLDVMIDGEWRTPATIKELTAVEWASASARLRDLRKEKFGGWLVERENVGKGLFKYRVLPPEPKADLFQDAGVDQSGPGFYDGDYTKIGSGAY